jgi:hypothetical protein
VGAVIKSVSFMEIELVCACPRVQPRIRSYGRFPNEVDGPKIEVWKWAKIASGLMLGFNPKRKLSMATRGNSHYVCAIPLFRGTLRRWLAR